MIDQWAGAEQFQKSRKVEMGHFNPNLFKKNDHNGGKISVSHCEGQIKEVL